MKYCARCGRAIKRNPISKYRVVYHLDCISSIEFEELIHQEQLGLSTDTINRNNVSSKSMSFQDHAERRAPFLKLVK